MTAAQLQEERRDAFLAQLDAWAAGDYPRYFAERRRYTNAAEMLAAQPTNEEAA